MRKKDDVIRKSRTASRSHFNGKNALTKFQWDSVDDQIQEDLIEPVVNVSKKRAAKRRDKDVDTMYVSSHDEDIYAPIKKKRVKTLHAEDYAEFVAEVEENEDNPYAIPSYGQTRLTPDDEEFVEELAIPKPKKKAERRANEAKDKKRAEEKARLEEEKETGEEPQVAAPKRAKRSFLAKIKDAIIISGGAANAKEKTDDERLEQLAVATDEVVSQTNALAAGTAPIDALMRAAKALTDAAAAIQGVVAQLAATEAKGDDVKSEKKATTARKAKKNAATKDDVQEEQAPLPATPEPTIEVKRAEKPSKPEKEQKPAKSKSKQKAKETAPEPEPIRDEFDEDFDPIAMWENMPDDDEEANPAAKTRDDESLNQWNDDFDEWDEVESKKKYARLQEDEEARPILQETPKVANASAIKARAKRARQDDRLESKPIDTFGELELKKPTLRALQHMGYVSPTPIQSGTIPSIQKGVDVMGQARTGTGKTAAFMIPIVEGVAESERCGQPLGLVVVPTRELAVQARDETVKIARYYDISVVACYGGKPIASQVEKIRKGVDVLVGTPGRIIDLANRGVLSLAKARWVVLDEADRMLDVGFRPDVERILRMTPSSRQTLLFSATLAPPVVRLAQMYMHDPEKFDFSCKDVASDTIEQYYITVDQDRKFDALVRLLEEQQPRQAIVFCRTKRHVDAVARRLVGKFPNVEAIHGDLPQTKRDRIMHDFRAEKIKVLVATDIVGRGIDVSTVSHIVNYDVPQYCDDYVHRVGRAGRMGREGVAFTLVTAEEGAELTRIEIRINKLLERKELANFEAYSKPQDSTAEERERKPVFGQRCARVRRAL